MERIVEAGRTRAEVRFSIESRGFVRFDTDFIDGYDRKGQLKWQSGWADIAEASYGLSRVILTERTGRRLILPYSLALLAALHWLLPSGAKLRQTDGRRSIGWRIASAAVLVSVGFAVSALIGGEFLRVWTTAEWTLQVFGLAVTVIVAVIFLIAPPQRRSMVLKSQAPPHAWHCLQLAGVLDDQIHWFQQRKRPAEISNQAGAASLIGFILAGGILIPLTSNMPPGHAASVRGGMVALCGMVVIAFFVTRLGARPPAGSWLAVHRDQAWLVLPDRKEHFPVILTARMSGFAEVDGRRAVIHLPDFLLAESPPEGFEAPLDPQEPALEPSVADGRDDD
jgi:hypothetical protein